VPGLEADDADPEANLAGVWAGESSPIHVPVDETTPKDSPGAKFSADFARMTQQQQGKQD
jgi:hypothetical protein